MGVWMENPLFRQYFLFHLLIATLFKLAPIRHLALQPGSCGLKSSDPPQAGEETHLERGEGSFQLAPTLRWPQGCPLDQAFNETTLFNGFFELSTGTF